MVKADGDALVPHYDPAIAVPFRGVTPQLATAGEAALWASYDRIACPVLLLRGADSDLLSRGTAQAMTVRGPKARLREFAGVGHAPTLVADRPGRSGAGVPAGLAVKTGAGEKPGTAAIVHLLGASAGAGDAA